jgi:hypothetical protein
MLEFLQHLMRNQSGGGLMGMMPKLGMMAGGKGLFGGMFPSPEDEEEEQPQQQNNANALAAIITRELMKNKSSGKWNDVINRFR